jgi:hypothetical protein
MDGASHELDTSKNMTEVSSCNLCWELGLQKLSEYFSRIKDICESRNDVSGSEVEPWQQIDPRNAVVSQDY